MCLRLSQGFWHAAWMDVSLEVVHTSGVKVVRATQTLLRATTQASPCALCLAFLQSLRRLSCRPVACAISK